MSKIVKSIGKCSVTALAAVGLAELLHKGKEAYTRKKAMKAAIRTNNKKATKKEET